MADNPQQKQEIATATPEKKVRRKFKGTPAQAFKLRVDKRLTYLLKNLVALGKIGGSRQSAPTPAQYEFTCKFVRERTEEALHALGRKLRAGEQKVQMAVSVVPEA